MVFDIAGRLIRTISLPDLYEGNIFWDLKATNGNKVNAGMYYLSIAGSSNNTLKKIILLP
jgi:flagellar hook assembly protein FlgD